LVTSIEVLAQDAPPHTIETARALLLEYGRFVTAVEGAERFGWDKLQAEVDALPGTYRNQSGEMLLADAGGVPAGCVAWRALTTIARACEMKRLWVRADFRGLKLGEELALTAIQHAALAGFDAIYLDTFPASMKPAFDMYLRLGFTPCNPFNDSRYDGVVFMRLSLR